MTCTDCFKCLKQLIPFFYLLPTKGAVSIREGKDSESAFFLVFATALNQVKEAEIESGRAFIYAERSTYSQNTV